MWIVDALALLGIVVALHALTVALIGRYYDLNLPHYDSVGSLTYGYRILNAYAAGGYRAAFGLLDVDTASSALSYTQAWFAALFAPLLGKTPGSFQLYNTFATALGMIGILIFARGAGFGVGTAGVAAVVYLLPDGLWLWEFGLVDYRRDPGMLGLLTASFFVLLALYTGRWSGRIRAALSLSLGLLVGLTAVSRDSAPLYVAGMVGVPGLLLAILDVRRSGWRDALRLLAPAAAGVLPFVVFVVLHLKTIAARLADPLISFGGGGDRWAALVGNLWVIDRLVRGPTIPLPAHLDVVALVVFALVAAVLAAAGLLRWAPPVQPEGRRIPRPDRVALVAGIWGVLWLHGFLSLYVGWRTSMPFSALAPPYLPALVGVYAVILAVASRFSLRAGPVLRLAALALGVAAVLGIAAVRLQERMTETPVWMRQANDDVARLRAANGGVPSFAELTFETVRIPMIAYKLEQNGLPPPRRVRFRSGRYDTAVGIPPTEAERDGLLREMEIAIRCEADFVVLSTRTEADPRFALLILQHGGAMAAAMLRDMPVAAGPYGNGDTVPVVVLDNRSRHTCRLPPPA